MYGDTNTLDSLQKNQGATLQIYLVVLNNLHCIVSDLAM
jgi:hypothetical protein